MVHDDLGDRMGTVQVNVGDEQIVRPLAEVTLVGRHWGCHLCLNDRRVPLFWLEIRWFARGWMWRALNPNNDTRGAGQIVQAGWRVLQRTGEMPRRVSLGEGLWLSLVDDGPPGVFGVDISTGEVLEDAALGELTERLGDQVVAIGWDEAEETRVVHDGDVLVTDGRAVRMHVPGRVPSTHQSGIDISVGGVGLEVDVERLEARISRSEAEVVVQGEPVRILAAYALARRDEHYDDRGWLEAQEAYSFWVQLGGNPGSSLKRMGWERGKLRTLIARTGTAGVAKLFERRRRGNQTLLRLALAPDSIQITGMSPTD